MATATKQAAAGGTTLLNGLVAYWKLDEASGNRADSETTGTGQTLSEYTAAVSSAAGKLSDAANFANTSTVNLYRNDSTDLSITGDITVACWVYLNGTSDQGFVCKWNLSANRSYGLAHTSSRFTLFLSSDGTAFTTLLANTAGAPSTGAWYLVVGTLSGSDAKISVNAGTQDGTTHSGGIYDGTGELFVGGLDSGVYPANARVDEVGIWNRALSTSEISELYNSGSGKTFPF